MIHDIEQTDAINGSLLVLLCFNAGNIKVLREKNKQKNKHGFLVCYQYDINMA